LYKLGILITTTADHSTLLLLKKNVEDLFAIGDIVYAHSSNKPWENAECSTNFPSSNNVLLIVILVKKQFAGFLQMYTSESNTAENCIKVQAKNVTKVWVVCYLMMSSSLNDINYFI
jgi:hypothetical protein